MFAVTIFKRYDALFAIEAQTTRLRIVASYRVQWLEQLF